MTSQAELKADQRDRIDVGALRVGLGYFLSRDASPRPFVEPDAPSGQWRTCSTYLDSPTTLKTAVLELIRGARNKVFVTSFILGDEELIDELTRAAGRLRGGVYVISQLDERSLERGLVGLDDLDDPGRKVEVEKKRFLSLTHQGVALRGHRSCHAKFVVVDDQVAWVGTANLETRAFTKVGEVGVVTSDRTTVSSLARLFTTLWFEGCSWELPSGATTYSVRDWRAVPAPCPAPAPLAVAPLSGAVWTSDDQQSVLDHIRDVMARARRRLLLASFNLNGMTGRPDLLLEPLAEVMARNDLDVRLFVRALNQREGHRRDAQSFHELGVEVLADTLNHAKAAVADDEHGLLFSANFDAQYGLEANKGIEVGARLDGTTALPGLIRYLDHVTACAPLTFVPNPDQRQLDERLRMTWTSRWPLPGETPVDTDQVTWEQFRSSTSAAPVLWTQAGDEPVELLAGEARWHLISGGSRGYRLRRIRTGSSEARTSQLVNLWSQPPGRHARPLTKKADRGFCPAVFIRRQEP
jgi:phosphatidylserine/phosphatidylglycerophosphate/cardiolipin synthase-like enzyme